MTTVPTRAQAGAFSASQLVRGIPEALRKLNPRAMWHNPVMFIVEVGAALTTALAIVKPDAFTWSITIWLWLTMLFATLAEAVAEGRGKAQAATLRKTRTTTLANRVLGYDQVTDASAEHARQESVASAELKLNDVVVVSAGELIPGDGDIIAGIASVDESAITGESAPVVRESGGDRSAVTGGTRVLSDRIVVRITSKPGETFVDRMIALVEGAARQKTPNEIALNILLASLTIIFVVVVLALGPTAGFAHAAPTVTVLVALLVCLIPTTIGALLSAIGIAGMDRLVQHNVLAMSGRAVEAAGDVSTLLLDKTGTITYGNRQAAEFRAVPGVADDELVAAAARAAVADPTPEGQSVVALAEALLPIPEERAARLEGSLTGFETRAPQAPRAPQPAGGAEGAEVVVPFTAQTRMSGVDFPDGRQLRKGAPSAIRAWVTERSPIDPETGRLFDDQVDEISRLGGTPLGVAEALPDGTARLLGTIHLKDIVKTGLKQRFADLRRMGIRTVMVTGDNPVTASVIAREAGVDDVLAEATPEDKLALIRREQQGGHLVAMTGDGTNDAPALAQADVGVAMNTGTSAAKEAGNMVDLDSDPTKLIDIVTIGKQLLITRGALTTFSVANDVAKYFAIIPAMFVTAFPGMQALNVMRLHSPDSAILSAVIFNALVIVALIPLALRGVRYRPSTVSSLLGRNLLIYGLGGIVAPFLGIKLIDLVVSLIPGF
jgi:K+-transporting ATPase ATPase B chain